jgi:hypothetical protein
MIVLWSLFINWPNPGSVKVFIFIIAPLINRLKVHDTIMVFIHQLTEPGFGQGFHFLLLHC